MPEATELQFDFESYLADLLEAMDMQEASPEVQEDVTQQLGSQLSYRLMTTLSLNFEDEDWSNLMSFTDAKEFKDLIEKAIEQNPKIKEAVIETLDQFYSETLEAYEAFKNV